MKKKGNDMKEKTEEVKNEESKDENQIDIEYVDSKKEELKEEVEKEEVSSESSDELDEAQKKIEKLENEVSELNDKLLRRAAEFENYKRRTENDMQNILKFAGEPFILSIIPIYDDLGRSLDHIGDSNNVESLSKGLKLVYDKFSKTLEENGIKRIECKGTEFDFNYHEALLQQPSDEYPPNTVIEEVEPGYVYKEKVIKHAKVIVSKEPENSEDKK